MSKEAYATFASPAESVLLCTALSLSPSLAALSFCLFVCQRLNTLRASLTVDMDEWITGLAAAAWDQSSSSVAINLLAGDAKPSASLTGCGRSSSPSRSFYSCILHLKYTRSECKEACLTEVDEATGNYTWVMFTNAPGLLLWPEWSQIKKQKREWERERVQKRKYKQRPTGVRRWTHFFVVHSCGNVEKTQVTFRKNKLHMLSTNTTDTSGFSCALFHSLWLIPPPPLACSYFHWRTRAKEREREEPKEPAGGLHTSKHT